MRRMRWPWALPDRTRARSGSRAWAIFDPDIVTFYGQDQMGMRTQLIQHVSQLSVMLRALPKQIEEAPPTLIGFQLVQDLGAGRETG